MQQSSVILFTLIVIGSAVAILTAYDLYAVMRGGMTLSQAWRNFFLEHPFAIYLAGIATPVPAILVAHLVWSVWEGKP